MCGRYTLTPEASQVLTAFPDLASNDLSLWGPPRYNIAPGESVLAIVWRRDSASHASPARPEHGSPALERLHWGLLPSWTTSRSGGLAPINARAETLSEKPMFRQAFRKRRCLILADGFYEWRREGKRRRPFYIRLRSGDVFTFAGIWESRSTETESNVLSTAIVTIEANDVIAPLHNRMPVLVPPAHRSLWLSPEINDIARVQPLLVPSPGSDWELCEVSDYVNNVRNEGPRCIA